MTIGKVKFSQLPAQVETDLNPNTIFAVVNLGMSKKATLTNVKNYLVTDGLATQEYVNTAINNLIGSAPDILDTLAELAAAIGNDGNFYLTIENMIGDAVTGLFPSKSTNDLVEGANNLYFTQDRSRSSISVNDPSGTLTYNNATGVFTFSAIDVPVLTVNGQTGDVVLDSDDITEGTANLYFSEPRARASISAGTGVNYDSTTGVMAIGQPVGVTDSPDFQNIEVFFNTSTQTLTVTGADQSDSPSTGAVVVLGGMGIAKNLNVGGDSNIGGDLTVDGELTVDSITATTITHQGLEPTEGTNIDQIKTYTRSLRLITDWQDVGINASNLATGTYIVQLYAHDISAGGTNNNEYYAGIMSWYATGTNSSLPQPTDEIPLHRSGGSSDGNLYLRTFRSPTGDPTGLKLQIFSNIEAASAANYVFKFRRVI